MERVGVSVAPPSADAQWPVLRWSDDQPLDLGAVVARCEFPQLVRLVDDVVNSLGATVACSGSVLKLHGLKTFRRLLLAPGRSIADGRSAAAVVAAARAQRRHQLGGGGADDDDQLLAMSLGYAARVRLLPLRAADHVYPTAGDLIAESPRPRAVVAHRRIVLPEKGYAIAAGDVLRVDGADKRCTSAGVVDYLQCRHQERTVGLPAACIGHFTALADEREYAVRELAEPDGGGGAIELPQRVRFLPLTEELRNGSGDNNEGTRASLSLSYALSCADLAETEYVACALLRRQYAVCTTADGEGGGGGGDDEWLYLIPVDDDPPAVDSCGDQQLVCANAPSPSPPPPPAAPQVRVHLPLFHDIASYNAVHGRFRANLSMKHVVDCAPVERASTFDAYRCSMRDGYDLVTPAVVPRRRCRGSPSAAAGGSECFDLTSGSDDTSDSRRSSSSRNGVAEDEKIFRLAPTSTCDHDTAPKLFVGSSIGLSSYTGCDNAYTVVPLGFSPDSRRRSSGATAAAAAASKQLVTSSSSAASPSLLRHQLLASCSQPATPQASRQKKAKWTEKLAQSLSNLRLAGGGSNSGRSNHSSSGPKPGRGSSTSPLQRRHLLTSGGGSDPTSTSSAESSDDDDETEMTAAATAAASFGCGRQPCKDRSPATADDAMHRRGSKAPLPDSVLPTSGGASGGLYENVSAVLLGIGFGRASPQQQRQSPAQPLRMPPRHEAIGSQLLQQQPVRELWAPPSLPDYRDHTTGAPPSSAAAAATAAFTPAVSVTAGAATATVLSSASFDRRPSRDVPVCANKSGRPSPSCSATRMSGDLLPPPPPPQLPERPAPSRSPCLPPQYGCQLPTMPADRHPATFGGMPLTHQPRSLLPTAIGGGGPVVFENSYVTSLPTDDECQPYTYLYFPPAADSRSVVEAAPVVAEPAHLPCLTGSQSAGPTASCWRSRDDHASPPGNSSSSALTSYGAVQLPVASQDDAVAATATTTTGIVRSLADVPDDLSTLSVVGLCSCLRLYNMANVAEKFLQQQVDGQFFMAMPETMFRDRCFDLSEFEVLKLKRLQNGWRPKMT